MLSESQNISRAGKESREDRLLKVMTERMTVKAQMDDVIQRAGVSVVARPLGKQLDGLDEMRDEYDALVDKWVALEAEEKTLRQQGSN